MKKSPSDARTSVFRKEIQQLKKSKALCDQDDLSLRNLKQDYQNLVQMFESLLHSAQKMMKISDTYQKKLILAGEKIKSQNLKLEEQNKKQRHLLQELKSLNVTKNKLFSILAHDLRNSIALQVSGSRFLSDGLDREDPETLRMVVLKLKENTQYLSDLLENLLNWSRFQMGNFQCRPTLFRLRECVEKTVETLMWNADQKKIELENAVHSEISAYADSLMVESVLRNLINNAIKFCRSGGLVSISARKTSEIVECTVMDSGVGIKKRQLKNIFQFGENRSTRGTRNEKGTGLGLVLCKDFIEKNGGKIFIDSTPGKGTSVRFTLPGKFPS